MLEIWTTIYSRRVFHSSLFILVFYIINVNTSLVKSIRSSLDVTIEAEDIRVVSTDKLSVEVLATALAGVAPPVVSLAVTDQIILLRRWATKSSLATADTFLGFVTENKYLPRGKLPWVFTFCSSPGSYWSSQTGWTVRRLVPCHTANTWSRRDGTGCPVPSGSCPW